MITMPMFPLGSVLFPHMPLRLRVFEERYLIMLSEMLQADRGEFGVVLIERGPEVGGGEHRFSTGTTAEITQLGAQEGYVGLRAQGHHRIEVVRWLEDAPHPVAEVEQLPELLWDPALRPRLGEAERVVRQALAAATEFVDDVWPADVQLADEPIALAWQLAGVAPLGPLDQLELLRSATAADLLNKLIAATQAAAATFAAGWSP